MLTLSLVSDVFISYSRHDRAYVVRLARHLMRAGLAVWYDYDLTAGDRFDTAIQRQINMCRALVVVLTPTAVDSEWVGREVAYAQDRGKPVLPLLLSRCQTPISLIRTHHEDVTDGGMPDDRFVARLRGLADSGRVVDAVATQPHPSGDPASMPATMERSSATTATATEIVADVPRRAEVPATHDVIGRRGWTRRRFLITAGSVGIVAATGTGTYVILNSGGAEGPPVSTPTRTGESPVSTPSPTGDSSAIQSVRIFKGETSYVYNVVWSPNGTRLATASADGNAQIWNTVTGQPIHTLTGDTGPYDGRWSVRWSPNGTQLATGGLNGSARIWNTATGQTIHTLIAAGSSVAWSPDGTQLATDMVDATAQIWDTATGQTIRVLTGHTEAVIDVAWSPNGTQLATASLDGTARIWNTATGQTIHILTDRTNSITAVAWSPNGTQLATASLYDTARTWNTATGKPIQTLVGSLRVAAWSPDGSRLATGMVDATARIWDTATGDPIHILTGHITPVKALAWSPNGTQLATASYEDTARTWNATTGHPIHTLTGHTLLVNDVAWSPNGTQLATASDDDTARTWNA
jgi:WD40 repeat protein